MTNIEPEFSLMTKQCWNSGNLTLSADTCPSKVALTDPNQLEQENVAPSALA